jgi:hypothetical protein
VRGERHEEITQPDPDRRNELLTVVRIAFPRDSRDLRLLAVVTSTDGAVHHGCLPEQSRKFCHPNEPFSSTENPETSSSRCYSAPLAGIEPATHGLGNRSERSVQVRLVR